MFSSIPAAKAAAARVAIVSAVGLGALVTSQLPAVADQAADQYQVTIAVPAEHPLVNVPFDITGTVTPAAAGEPVQLQRQVGGRFETIATAKLDADSNYRFTKILGTVGPYVYRVLKPWGNGLERGFSVAARIWVTGDTIIAGHAIQSEDDLISESGMYRLWMRPNGNLELDLISNGRYVWSTRTGGHPGAWAILQRDGNLVVHDADGTVLKDTGSGGHADGAYSLTVMGDANLTIFTPGGSPIWSSHSTNNMLMPSDSLQPGQYISSADNRYQVFMKANGLLVIYDNQRKTAIWDSYTDTADSAVVMQTDGNLMLRGPYGKPLWSSRTNDAGAYAVIQNDGNLIVFLGKTPVWGSAGINGVLGDDYPGFLRNAGRDTLIDPWRFYNRECVSFVAWRINHANRVEFSNFMDGGHFGNANNWDDNARQLGYTVDRVPARGAIAQSDSNGSVGHVAWVAAVGDGTVTIEDYNYNAPGEYGVRTVPASSYIYIHIKDL